MIPIGPFSELTGLSVKALRHYHEQGLLIPERIDGRSQERAYSAWQLLEASRIAALRRAGVPIAQVKAIIAEPDGAAGELHSFEESMRARRRQEDAALAEARVALAAEPRVVVRDAPHEVAVRLPASAQLGTLTLAVAHLLDHVVDGYFADVARVRSTPLGDEVEYAAPLEPMPPGDPA